MPGDDADRWHGQVTLDGCSLRSLTPQERSRRIALLPQVLPRPPITVRTLTSYGRQPYLGWGGQLSAADEQKVQRAMEQAEIAAHAEDLVCHCSGGDASWLTLRCCWRRIRRWCCWTNPRPVWTWNTAVLSMRFCAG